MRVLVMSPDAETARQLGSDALKAVADEVEWQHEKHPTEARLIRVGRPRYPQDYYEPHRLTVKLLCEDTSRAWVSGRRD